MESIKKEIQSAFEFVGHGIDQKGKAYSFQNYSILVQLYPTQIDEVVKSFPDFSVVPLGFNNYYTIGFNKKKI